MSKRKLLRLVEEGHVRGWDDPRMPTLAALRRRGYSPEAIRTFCDMIGVAKANSMVDIGKLEYCVRDDLNQTAPRVLGVLRPIEVEIEGAPAASTIDAPLFPADVGKPGSRPLSVSSRVLIDRDDWSDNPPADYKRLALGRTVRLRHSGFITAEEVVARDAAGIPTKIRAKAIANAKGAGVIHWVDAATSVPAEIRIYERLFKVPRPEEGGGDFLEHLDKGSLEVVTSARVEQSLANAAVGSRWQLERIGYFIVDEDSKPGALVLNKIISLRDERPAVSAGATLVQDPNTVSATANVTSKQNAKAATRPKSKSPLEYRTEARARDANLAAAYAKAQELGIPAEQADLLTGDSATANLMLETAATVGDAALVAKWMINELPRALAGKELAEVTTVDAKRLSELLLHVKDGRAMPAAAKTALAGLVATGKVELEATATVDLGSAVDAVIAANPDKAAQYKAGKTGLLGFFVGQVMRSTPNADAAAVNAKLRERLG
jgi:glutaminyl-tRNA synthetase